MSDTIIEIVHALDRGETRDEEVKKILRKFRKESVGVQNQLLNEMASWLLNYDKRTLKRFMKERSDIFDDLDEDEIKPYITVANEVMNKFNLITLQIEDFDTIKEKTLCFNKYCYLTNLKKVRTFISNRIRDNNLPYNSTRSETIRYIKDQTLFECRDLNFNPNVMVFKNGILDFDTGRFRKLINKDDPVPEGWNDECIYRRPEDEYYFYELDCEFDPDNEYDCSFFKKTLVQWIDEKTQKGYRKGKRTLLINDVFEMMGLCMTMRMSMKASFLNYGPQNCGKTQFYNILSFILGHRNMSNTSLQRLGKNEFGAEGMQFKILNYCGDLPSSKILDTGLFKSITGEDIMIESEKKGGEKHTLYLTCKFWFNANKVPKLGTWDDDASYDRFIMIPFPNEFLRNHKDTKESLWKMITNDPNEIQGIVHECIRGYQRLLERGNFREILRENTKHIWQYHSDKIYAFVYDHCEIKKGRILCDEFVESINESHPGMSTNTITRGLQRLGVFRKQGRIKQGPKKGNQADFYRGIVWKEVRLIKEDDEEVERLIDEF